MAEVIHILFWTKYNFTVCLLLSYNFDLNKKCYKINYLMLWIIKRCSSYSKQNFLSRRIWVHSKNKGFSASCFTCLVPYKKWSYFFFLFFSFFFLFFLFSSFLFSVHKLNFCTLQVQFRPTRVKFQNVFHLELWGIHLKCFSKQFINL